MTIGFVDDGSDFGTDIALVDDLAPVWGLASGEVNLAYSQLRRFTTPSGALDVIEDEPYDSLDIRGYLNKRIDANTVSFLKSRLATVAKGDPRVKTCVADVIFSMSRKELTIAIKEETNLGPFEMVIVASAVTADILSINGVASPAAAATTTSAVQIVTVSGEAGPPGPAGAPGSGGSAQATLDFGSNIGSVSSGAEEVIDGMQRQVRFGDLGASLTVALIAQAASASGTSTFKLRIGGSKDVADGTVVLTMTRPGTPFATITASNSFSNPTGNLWVKVTAQNAVVGQSADITGCVVTIR